MATETTDTQNASRGFVFALTAYLIWGAMPIFMKLMADMPATEVVAHRVVWSVPLAGVVLLLLGGTADVKAALRSPRTMLMVVVTASLISVNWGVYIWAIAMDRAIETAMGYYINPLMSIVMAAALLGERLSPAQLVASGLAVVAVLILAFDAGGIPWISLALAISFTLYGYLRKTLPIGPSQGFFLEVLILCIPALGYILWLTANGQSHFVQSNPHDMLLLLACGPITSIPLLMYAFGAKLLRLSTISIMQYIAPTMVFIIAIFVFNEPFNSIRAVAFVLIWAALAIYSWSMFARRGDTPA